jgi:hypothetical protein
MTERDVENLLENASAQSLATLQYEALYNSDGDTRKWFLALLEQAMAVKQKAVIDRKEFIR